MVMKLHTSITQCIILLLLIYIFSSTHPFRTDGTPTANKNRKQKVRGEQGIQQWKRVRVNLEDHIKVPIFPVGLESYDKYVQDYLSEIAMDQLPQDRPLWNIHVIKYPTSSGAGTIVLKLHHAIGDGFSLMGALFSCLQRADDPSLPLTFPASRAKPEPEHGVIGMSRRVPRVLSIWGNTIRGFWWSLLKSNLMEDDRTPVRSGTAGVEFQPKTISTVTFSLDDIRKIKAKLDVTVNDVICGTIFYGTQLYLQAAGHGTKHAQMTAMVVLNTCVIRNYQTLDEMTKPDSKSPWGNRAAFLHVAIPKCKDAENGDPLNFVLKAREIIKAKRSSLEAYLTAKLLEILRKIKGPEGPARYIHATLRNTTMTISNLIGPKEQMMISGYPIRNFYFMSVGGPQSLTMTVVSYMGKLKVAIGAEKGFINSELLITCMEKSFERIFEAALSARNLA